MFRRLIIRLVILLLCLCESVWCQEFGLIGDAIEARNPCETHVLLMERIIGKPPSEENYWDGTINFEKYKNLPEARVTLMLTAPATITMDEEDGRIVVSDDAFHMSFFKKKDGSFRAQFTVHGRPKGDFPNLAGLYLNGVDICPNKIEWKPTLLGATNTGSVDLVNRTSEIDPASLSPCGRRIVQHQGLITNGYPSQEGDWPWHAAIYHIDSTVSAYKCGGTLITMKAVITAAHCINEMSKTIVPERILVKLGQHDRRIASSNTQEHRIFKVIQHEEFMPGELRNDIAILKLSTEVSLTDYIQPACLWDKSSVDLNDVVNEAGYVVGWGFNEHDTLNDVLSQGRMPVVSLTTCLNSNRPFFGNFLTDMNYCAGFRNGTSVCNGDSGGGMFFKRNGVYRLRGIVSLSVLREDKRVCNTKHYVLFTDSAKYLNWIETSLKD